MNHSIYIQKMFYRVLFWVKKDQCVQENWNKNWLGALKLPAYFQLKPKNVIMTQNNNINIAEEYEFTVCLTPVIYYSTAAMLIRYQ